MTPSGRRPRESFGAAVALALLLCFAVLTAWISQRWALGAFQCGVCCIGIAAAARQLGGPAEPVPFPVIPLTGVPLWAGVQLALSWTVYRYATWQALLHWWTVLTLFWIAYQVLRNRTREWFLKAMLWFVCVLSILSVVQYFAAPGSVLGLFPVVRGNVGPFLNRDHYAILVELTLPVALYQALRDGRATSRYVLLAAILIASVIAVGARLGSVLVVSEAIVAVLLSRPAEGRAKTRAKVLLSLAVAVSGLIAVAGCQLLWSRFQNADMTDVRLQLLRSSATMVRERPWTGFGLGTWPVVYPAYAAADWGVFVNHSHNDWAEWTAEGGIVVLLLLASLALWTLRQAASFSWSLGVVVVFCHALADFPMQRTALAAVLSVLLGAVAAAQRETRQAAGNAPAPACVTHKFRLLQLRLRR